MKGQDEYKDVFVAANSRVEQDAENSILNYGDVSLGRITEAERLC